LGVAIVSWLAAARLLQRERLRAVDIRDLDLRRQCEIVILRGVGISANTLAFIEFLGEFPACVEEFCVPSKNTRACSLFAK
jgi:hypothetical protein